MKSLNLQRILTLITACSLLAALVVRTAPCSMERCPMQAAEMKKSGCCTSMASPGGMLPQDATDPMITAIPDFTYVLPTGSGSNCHSSGITLAVKSSGTDEMVLTGRTGQPIQSDQPESSPRSGCDNCDCEIRSSSDTEARAAIAVSVPDVTLAGPALTGETVRKPSATVFINNFTKRAPPHPGVPAYILNASLLN